MVSSDPNHLRDVVGITRTDNDVRWAFEPGAIVAMRDQVFGRIEDRRSGQNGTKVGKERAVGRHIRPPGRRGITRGIISFGLDSTRRQ
jgi:hypothetical protein